MFLFLFQVIDIPSPDDSMELSYDLEWLTILYLTNHLMSSKATSQYMPGPSSDERFVCYVTSYRVATSSTFSAWETFKDL